MYNIKRILSDKEKCRKWYTEHQSSVKAWSAFVVAVIVIFFLLSDGDYSFLLTLSSFIGMFSFLMVTFKIEKNRSCAGVSLKMFECYVLLLLARLSSIMMFEGYLPFDRTGDWFYQLTEALSLIFAGCVVYMCRSRFKDTYDAGSDSLNHLFLIIPTGILALLFHPSLNSFMPADAAWAFALFLEAVCCLPQLFMFQKEPRVEPFTTHFLAGQALSKVVSFLFWLSCYAELNDPTKRFKSYVGVWVIVMQIIQLAVMGDFIHHYIRCLSRGVSVEFFLIENV